LIQSSSWVSRATPLLTQNVSGLELNIRTHITKLVECPVVDSTPFRADVLYNGQL